MNSNSESIRSVSWRDLCPWLVILKAVPISAGMGVIVLATLAVILAPIGWWISAFVFVNDEMRQDYHFDGDVRKNSSTSAAVFETANDEPVSMGLVATRITGPALVFTHLVEPFYHLFHDIEGLRRFCYYFFGCLWSLLVWGFFGCCICRIAMLRLCRGERIGIVEAITYGASKLPTTIGGLGIPLITISVICLPLFVVGLLMAFDFGLFVAGILWIFVLILILPVAVLLLGLAFGWPLIIASVGAEGQGAFDAMTRGYAYTFQKPFHYLFYAIVSLVVGGLIWMIASHFTDGVINLSYWSTSWGANVVKNSRTDQIRDPAKSADADAEARTTSGNLAKTSEAKTPRKSQGNPKLNPPNMVGDNDTQLGDGKNSDDGGFPGDPEDSTEDPPSWTMIKGGQIIDFWNWVLRTIASGFLHGLFWCLASATYLLLRRDVDDTEMDEVFLDDARRTFELPPLENDADNIPQIQEGSNVESDVESNDDPDQDAAGESGTASDGNQ